MQTRADIILKGKVQMVGFRIKQESPSFAAIDDIKVVYGSYKGEFSSFKRQGADVPDEKQDKTIVILKDVKEDTKYIPGIKDDTSKLLGKQDKSMEILDSVKQDTGEMTDTLTFLKAVYRETLELKEKYEVLSRVVAAIKIKLKAG